MSLLAIFDVSTNLQNFVIAIVLTTYLTVQLLSLSRREV